MKEYFEDPRINASLLKRYLTLDRAIAKQPQTGTSSSMSLGTLVHLLMETGEAEGYVTHDFPDLRKKEYKDWLKAQDPSYNIIKAKELEDAQMMAMSLWTCAPDWAKDGDKEVAVYTDRFKALLDVKAGNKGLDWKTTSAQSAEQFEREMIKYGYHLQAYHYSMVAGLDEFVFCAVSTVYPFPAWRFDVTPEYLEFGKNAWDKAMQKMEEPCPQKEYQLNPPKWFSSPSEVFAS
jgi:hypothetical protein